MEKLFRLKENGTSVRTELLAGLTTFMTMAYIVALNPNLLTNFGAEGKDLSRARAADLGSESVVQPVLCEGNSEFPELFFHIGPGSRQASSGLRDAVQIPSVFCDGVLEFTAFFPHGFPPLRSFSFEDFLQGKDDQGNADHLEDTGD